MDQITLTDSLVARMRQLQSDRNDPGLMLRLAVDGGGCKGYSYNFAFADAPEPDDHAFVKDGVTLVVDSISLDLLAGSEVDYVDEIAGAAFRVRNPNAESSCGCGTSFST